MARRKIVAGNWKMNKTPSEAVALVNELKPLVANDEVDVVFCVPAIDIIPVAEAVKGTNIQVGAENMYFEESGAYTGEIAPNMLVDAGVKYVEKIKEKNEKQKLYVRIFSDSSYCVNALNQRWIKKWLNNNWTTSKGTPVLNKDLWLEINKFDKLIDFQLIKVKGHSGNIYNEECDKLAKEAIPN